MRYQAQTLSKHMRVHRSSGDSDSDSAEDVAEVPAVHQLIGEEEEQSKIAVLSLCEFLKVLLFSHVCKRCEARQSNAVCM
jgi:hypothetical protein